MTPLFALNYSHQAADLLRTGRIPLDRFKLPAWPDLIALAQAIYPSFVHFPLRVGAGIGDAINSETKRPVDWGWVEALLRQTATPLVNLHLSPEPTEVPPGMEWGAVDDAAAAAIGERLLRDVTAVVRRLGPEHVIVENDHCLMGDTPPAACLPAVIRRVVEETGCGFLLDLSHARMAAVALGMDVYAYLNGLPLSRTREVHVTGIQRLDGHWLERLRRAEVDEAVIAHYAGRLFDHLPLVDADWEFTVWAMDQLHCGAWGDPWAVTFEYGGVKSLIGGVTDADILAEQTPRLYRLVKGIH